MNFSTQRLVSLAAVVVLSAWITGCASPGTPRPPSLHLPERVTKLSAERHGNSVVLRFVTPVRSTDDEPLTAPVTAGLCRAVGDGPCRFTASFPGKVTISGPVEWVDVLPPDLASGSAQKLTYRVETFNSRGRSFGPSDPAFAAAGQAPNPVEALRVEGSHTGVVLRWTPESQASGEVLVEREDLAVPKQAPAPAKQTMVVPKGVAGHKNRTSVAKPAMTPVSAKNESVAWLHAGEADHGGMADTSAKPDEPYRYTAVRRRVDSIDGQKFELRSTTSQPVSITLRDTYPPAIPHGLMAAGFPVPTTDGLAVDLIWQPNVETDLAGYNVYRRVIAADGTAAGASTKLNSKPVPLPAFHDITIAHGVAYRYTVTALDSKGNESAASVATDLAATP